MTGMHSQLHDIGCRSYFLYSNPIKVALRSPTRYGLMRPFTACGVEVDMGFGNPVIAGFATYVNGTERNLSPEMPYTTCDGDYPFTKPYIYPERRFWSYNRAIDVCNTVFNLIEIDLVKNRNLKELRVISLAADSAGGIYGVAAHCI